MNKLSTLKVFAATYVSESDLSREDKIDLIKFIKEGEYADVMNVIEGEYQAPQITEYVAEQLNYILEATPKWQKNIPPAIPKQTKQKVKSKGFGFKDYSKAKKERKATEKAVRKFMPDASKANVKGAKNFVKPLRSIERVALGKAVTKVGAAAGGIALAAAGAHAVYQRYMSKASRVCKGKPNKEVCMAQYRKKAKASKNIHKIKKLRVAHRACVNTRNPLVCKRKIDKKIKRLKESHEHINELRGGLMGPLGIAFDVLFVFELGAMTYRRFFSKASKACKGAPDRKMCVLRFKIKAKEAQMKVIRSKSGGCVKAKDPKVCKGKIVKKLYSLRSDIAMLRQEII